MSPFGSSPTTSSQVVPGRPEAGSSLVPSPIGDEDDLRPRPQLVPTPAQLELFEPLDDGLDFGAWMERLPLDPGGNSAIPLRKARCQTTVGIALFRFARRDPSGER
jgi:hypothetical protein